MNQNQNDQKQNKIRYRVCVFLAGSFLVHWQKQIKKRDCTSFESGGGWNGFIKIQKEKKGKHYSNKNETK